MSAFKLETWIKKGYSIEEAKYQIKIRRPTNVEYYIHKFNVDLEKAEEMRLEHQKKGAKTNSNKPKESFKRLSPRCIEYWEYKGLSTPEAILRVSEIQSTFSREKCIQKYGYDVGLSIWIDRQEKWNLTLNSKSVDELNLINSKKSTFKLTTFIEKYGEIFGRQKFVENLISRNCEIFYSLEDIKLFILKNLGEFDLYLSMVNFKKKYLKSYYFELVNDKPENIDSWLRTFLEFKSTDAPILLKGKHGNYLYSMKVENKLLRSSNEILFYYMLVENGFVNGVDFIIEKYYPNSKMRCDFYLISSNVWVELAGYTDDVYIQKMKYKESTFGSVILTNKNDYKQFIKTYTQNLL